MTSGSVGVGCKILNSPKPKDLAGKQAFAAVGQVHLMRMYEDFFTTLDLKGCASVGKFRQHARPKAIRERKEGRSVLSYRNVSFQLLMKTILWLFKPSSLEIMIR